MTQPKTREELEADVWAKYPEALGVAAEYDFLQQKYRWMAETVHGVFFHNGSSKWPCWPVGAFGCTAVELRELFNADYDGLLHRVQVNRHPGTATQSQPVSASQAQPTCKWNNKAAPDFNVQWPTKPQSYSPYAKESFTAACRAAEAEAVKKMKRTLPSYPTCYRDGGAVALVFDGFGKARWECKCVPPSQFVSKTSKMAEVYTDYAPDFRLHTHGNP